MALLGRLLQKIARREHPGPIVSPPSSEATESDRRSARDDNAMAEAARGGIDLLDEGDTAGAVRAFRYALAKEPGVASNHVNLAYALQQQGSHDQALIELRSAVALDAESFDASYMLAMALEEMADHPGAIEHFRAAVHLRPSHEVARADLCRVLALSGDTAAARETILSAIEAHPRSAGLRHALANLEMTEGDPASALESYDVALAMRPADPTMLANKGWAQQALGRHAEALDSLGQALAIDSTIAEIHVKLGLALKAQGRIGEATASLRQAVGLRPHHAETLNHLGNLLQQQGILEEAIAVYRRVIDEAPDLPGGYANLGLALYEFGSVQEAIAAYRKGLERRPIAETHDNLAIALQKCGFIDEAIEHYRQALALQPDNLNTRCNLAGALAEGHGPAAAIAAFRSILEILPRHMVAHSNLLFNLSVDPACSRADYLDEARRFGAKLGPPMPSATRTPGLGPRRLRVGLVSGDLRSHPVGYFLEGILHHLDATRVELFAYPTIAKEDELTRRIRPLFAGWTLLKGLDDAAAAAAIRQDGIDILLDLSGHTGDNRVPVFGLRPAPVQASWLGFFASTGVGTMDWILADDVCVPEGHESQFIEKVWRLPETRLCFTPPTDGSTPEVSPLPALRNGHVTFGCFQRLSKMNESVLDVWRDVFQALPTARLLLQGPYSGQPSSVDQILDRLAAIGLGRDRITVRPPAPRHDYLASYHEVDIVLDTFPYTGGTTTCEALWMGVPTVTLEGHSMISRQGVAMLRAAGLPEWVAEDGAAYVRKAVAFANDTGRLVELRSSVRRRLPATTLFDVQRFARNLEVALTGMWQQHVELPRV